MDEPTMGLVGGVAGGVLGVLGGVVGCFFGIRNTNGPRERAFAGWASVGIAAAVVGFLLAMWLTPMPYRPLWWLPYSVGLPLAVRAGNRRQQRLRAEERRR